MRTKSENKDQASEALGEDQVLALAAAEREELEELRAERAARLLQEKVLEEASKKAASSITLNLPPAAGKGIQLSGRMFYHGHTYNVSNEIKWALEEAERRCWAHESSLHESENKGRKQRRAFVGTVE